MMRVRVVEKHRDDRNPSFPGVPSLIVSYSYPPFLFRAGTRFGTFLAGACPGGFPAGGPPAGGWPGGGSSSGG